MTISDILREHAIYSRSTSIADIKDDVAFSIAWDAYMPTDQDYAMYGVEKRMFLCFLAEALENPC